MTKSKFLRSSLLLAVAAVACLASSAAAAAASTDPIAVAERAEDKGQPHKPPVFAPDRRNPEIETLRAEVQKLRAQVEMCRADFDRKVASAAAAASLAPK